MSLRRADHSNGHVTIGRYSIIITTVIIILIIIVDKSPYYKYTPSNVLESDNFKLYWNRSIITDKTMPANRPDITSTKKENKVNTKN